MRTPDFAVFDAPMVAVNRFVKVILHVGKIVFDGFIHQQLHFVMQGPLITQGNRT